jgi:hypothetical protein
MQTSEAVVAVTGMAVGLGLPLLLVAAVLFYKHQRERIHQETILRLAEKGVPVPPELLARPSRRPSPKAGLVLVSLGIALACFLWERGLPWTISLVPGLMGLALLVAWRIDLRSFADPTPPR